MSKKHTLRDSDTDWKRIDAMRDEDIDLSDIPEVTGKQMARAVLRVGGKPLPKGKVSILLDAEVVAYFKMKAGKNKFESVINDILKADIRNQNLESVL